MESCDSTEIFKPKRIFLFPLTVLILVILLPLLIHFNQTSSKVLYPTTTLVEPVTTSCNNLFLGKWVPYLEQPYYDQTCPFITEKQNCLFHGRPDTDFLKWRWKPDDCELPMFDAKRFLKIVEGKSMAFVGDSIGRNQMESLMCLLNSVARAEDITTKYVSSIEDLTYFKWWFYADYNFTIAMLWSPFLVKSSKSYIYNISNFYKPESLYLDEPDTAWTSRIKNFDYVIFSGGQWFFRPFTFYENGIIVGCQKCNNSIELNYYGYKKAYQTAFETIMDLNRFNGLAFLVTHSPNHFENGEWNNGGGCNRTQPFSNEQKWDVHPYGLEIIHQIQLDEFSAAKNDTRVNGSRFGLIDITDAMLMRPDGHPNKYGHESGKNASINDCVHWCMPGPVDTINEIFLYMIMRMKL